MRVRMASTWDFLQLRGLMLELYKKKKKKKDPGDRIFSNLFKTHLLQKSTISYDQLNSWHGTGITS